MKKIFLTILMLFMLPLNVFGEELYPCGYGQHETRETHPIYFGYMDDYASLLREALEKKKMFKMRSLGASYDFIITRDGEIKDMKLSVMSFDFFNEKVKEVILSVKPLPFREGMDLDYMYFTVYLGFENYEEMNALIGCLKGNDSIFHITIILKK